MIQRITQIVGQLQIYVQTGQKRGPYIATGGLKRIEAYYTRLLPAYCNTSDFAAQQLNTCDIIGRCRFAEIFNFCICKSVNMLYTLIRY